MASSELSLEEIHEYLVQKGGIVSNRECVRHFRKYLTDPNSKDEARHKFKKFVNTLATTKSEGDDKFLILRPKFAAALDLQMPSFLPPSPQCDPRNSVGIPTSPMSLRLDFSPVSSPGPRQPPPYRPPPPVTPNSSITSQNLSFQETPKSAPKAPPRRKSGDVKNTNTNTSIKDADSKDNLSVLSVSEDKENEGGENKISVKERTQKFNRLASHDEETTSPKPKQDLKKKKEAEKKGADEEDGASVSSLDPKRCADWFVNASKSDYHVLVKLAQEEPRLVKLKDPFTAYTVLHWAAKHGNQDVIKHFAGKHSANVNAKTNGGYTPLHIAAKFGRKGAFEILKDVYKANPEIRDNNGRKPDYYLHAQQSMGAKVTHKIKGRKKQTDKDLGFLRIGSLNVRVKKTTEAFSNFLGVGGNSVNPTDAMSDKVHKGWGSADNIGQSNEGMPAPKGYVSKRKSKRPLESSGTHSTPGTPSQIQRSLSHRNSAQDSDSDTAAGFDSNWQN